MERAKVKYSGNIASAGFENGIATVEFKNGGIYQSKDVSEKEWEAFQSTFDDEDSSTGSHYAKNLRSKNWKKLGDE